jgi:hypothetical protein
MQLVTGDDGDTPVPYPLGIERAVRPVRDPEAGPLSGPFFEPATCPWPARIVIQGVGLRGHVEIIAETLARVLPLWSGSETWAMVLPARRATPGAHADVAQLVAHHLAKVRVAGSSPVVRSERSRASHVRASLRWSGREARQRPAKPCTRVQIPSPPRRNHRFCGRLAQWESATLTR